VAIQALHNQIPGVTLMHASRARRAACAAALLAVAGPLVAQNPAVVRGAVVAETGERIPYALVVLEPRFSQRFADDQGNFTFLGVAPGQYRLLVRQVGYHPFDSALTVSASTPPLRIELRRIAVELNSITVAAAARCRTSGHADPVADNQLATVFEQLSLNAQRQSVLLDRYPYEYFLVRQLSDIIRSPQSQNRVTTRTRTDTLSYMSSSRWPYGIGKVATPSENDTRTKLVHLPVLADFADSLFQAWHCFSYGGLEAVDEQRLIRLNFKASERLHEPDVNGSVWLDPETYQVVRTQVELTKLERVADGVLRWQATTTFRQILPYLSVTQRMDATTTHTDASVAGIVIGRTERQDLLRVVFHGAQPGSNNVP
jgi:hypothetical protein